MQDDIDFLLSREDYYIHLYKSIYNIIPIVSNTAGWKHTEESCKKITQNYS